MRRRNRELNALNAMAVVAAQSFDLDEILNLTLRQVVTLFGAESGTVYLSDTDAPTYRRRAAWGPRSRDKVRAAEISFAEGFGDLVVRSRFIADSRASVLEQGAEFLRAKAAGLIDDSHIAGEIGQVLAGQVEGRRSPEEITVYKSLGHVVQDLASAWALYSQPER